MWLALLFYKQGLFFCSPPEIARSTISMFTSQQIEQLKKIYFEEFGIELTTPAALERAILLITGIKKVVDLTKPKNTDDETQFSHK